jgi:uncharacterized protein YfaS (alpha-2-macroglobulin family)
MLDPDLLAEGSIDDKIQAGIDRLLSMQTPSGGFGIWPGDTDPVLFGSAYVVHLLLDAKAKGYRVPEDALAEAVSWLDRNAESTEGGPKFRGTHPGYVEYVLARAGRPHTAIVKKMLTDQAAGRGGALDEGRMLLMATLQAAGDRSYEAELRAPDTTELSWRRANDWSYYSDLRRRALTLAVYHELFGTDAGGVPLAELVAAGLRRETSRGYTTQELMWGVSALGKWVGSPGKIPAAKLLFNGTPVAASRDRSKPSGEAAWQLAGGSRAQSVTVTFAAPPTVPLALIVTTEGVKPDEVVPTGVHGLKVERQWRNGVGAPVSVGALEVGQLIYVHLTATNVSTDRIENVAIVDRIPAGWEIENPRLGRGMLPDWATPEDDWTADYLDIKDDRYMIFGGLDAHQNADVWYAVRVVSAGRYTMPGMHAEAMYDPEIWGRMGPSEGVVISGSWSPDQVLE